MSRLTGGQGGCNAPLHLKGWLCHPVTLRSKVLNAILRRSNKERKQCNVYTHRKKDVYVYTHRKERCVTMASVNFEKIKSRAEVKAMFRHCDSEERMKHEHSNGDIDKELTKYNFDVFDYKTACTRFDERLDYLDSLEGANKRKDRVIAFGLCIPMPEDIPRTKRKEFMIAVHNCLSQQYNDDNLVAMYLHTDEYHEYTDAETKQKRRSLDHLHVYYIPEIKGKLNGKEFSSKKNMIKLNEAIHDMCQKQFGVDFMTGSKKKSKKSVETLKNKSREIEHEQVMKRKENELDERIRRFKAKEVSVQQREEEARKTHENALKMQEQYEAMIKQVQHDMDYIRERYEVMEEDYKKHNEIEKAKRVQEEQKNIVETSKKLPKLEELKREKRKMDIATADDILNACTLDAPLR